MHVCVCPYDITRSDLFTNTKICIWLKLSISRLTLQALSCIPLSLHIPAFAIDMMFWQWVETLAKVLDLAELVLGTALHVLNLALHNHSFGECFIVALRLD